MTKLVATALVSCIALTTACKKKEPAADDKAAKPAEAPATAPVAKAAAPVAKAAAPADKKLPQLGITITIPSDAAIDEHKTDDGGTQATLSYPGMNNFFVSNVGDGADSLDVTVKHAEAKEWKLQDKGADGTWKLEWTKPDVADPAKLAYCVATRAKVGAALYDCGSCGLDESQATALLQVCATLK